MWVGSERSTLCASANEELGTLADNSPLTGYEPKFFDNHQISETTVIFIQESSSDSRPSNLHDWEISDYTIGRALSSPLFTQEREDPASRRQAYHSADESILVLSRTSTLRSSLRFSDWLSTRTALPTIRDGAMLPLSVLHPDTTPTTCNRWLSLMFRLFS